MPTAVLFLFLASFRFLLLLFYRRVHSNNEPNLSKKVATTRGPPRACFSSPFDVFSFSRCCCCWGEGSDGNGRRVRCCSVRVLLLFVPFCCYTHVRACTQTHIHTNENVESRAATCELGFFSSTTESFVVAARSVPSLSVSLWLSLSFFVFLLRTFWGPRGGSTKQGGLGGNKQNVACGQRAGEGLSRGRHAHTHIQQTPLPFHAGTEAWTADFS